MKDCDIHFQDIHNTNATDTSAAKKIIFDNPFVWQLITTKYIFGKYIKLGNTKILHFATKP